MLWGGGVDIASIVRCEPMELPMQTLNNLSRSLIPLEPASTLIAVIEWGGSGFRYTTRVANCYLIAAHDPHRRDCLAGHVRFEVRRETGKE